MIGLELKTLIQRYAFVLWTSANVFLTAFLLNSELKILFFDLVFGRGVVFYLYQNHNPKIDKPPEFLLDSRIYGSEDANVQGYVEAQFLQL